MSSLFNKSLAPSRELKVSDADFLQLRDFIYQQSGIFIAENRKYLVENRLSNRLKELNLKTFGEYYYFLRFDKSRKEELTRSRVRARSVKASRTCGVKSGEDW